MPASCEISLCAPSKPFPASRRGNTSSHWTSPAASGRRKSQFPKAQGPKKCPPCSPSRTEATKSFPHRLSPGPHTANRPTTVIIAASRNDNHVSCLHFTCKVGSRPMRVQRMIHLHHPCPEPVCRKATPQIHAPRPMRIQIQAQLRLYRLGERCAGGLSEGKATLELPSESLWAGGLRKRLHQRSMRRYSMAIPRHTPHSQWRTIRP